VRKTHRGLVVALIAVAVLVSCAVVAVVGWLLLGRSDPTAGDTARQSAPIRFQHITAETPGSCTSGGAPAADGSTCYQLGDGMTVTQARSIRVLGSDGNNPGWRIEIDLSPSDAQAFAELTQKAATETPGSPQQRIAIVVGGRVVSAPAVQSAIPGGKIEIQGGYTRRSAEQLFHQITG
jgi:preprotein translocase subunit SecD